MCDGGGDPRMSQLHQERAPGAKERSRFPIDPPDLRIRTEHPRLRARGMRANNLEALLQRGSIDRFRFVAHDRPAEISLVRRSQPSCSHPHLRLTTMRAALRIPAGPGHANPRTSFGWPKISLVSWGWAQSPGVNVQEAPAPVFCLSSFGPIVQVS